MQWAEGGSLDDFISLRLGLPSRHPHIHPGPLAEAGGFNFAAVAAGANGGNVDALLNPTGESEPRADLLDVDVNGPNDGKKQYEKYWAEYHLANPQSRTARIRAFRAYQAMTPSERIRHRHAQDSKLRAAARGEMNGTGKHATELVA
jgi:hypothetical protein